ncbi:ceramide kinase-like [Pomacea canaliculata]|uniref:ceramide kinase-like n=1 Tax=Pomacea canaliculata TaxID=400727 RepID=UPI000D72F26F|nr:ceramide kinase-like [Pomacea canaliculata]
MTRWLQPAFCGGPLRHSSGQQTALPQVLTLSSDRATCQTLVDALKDELRATDRPKRLVVIVNPNSGKKQAEKVFNKKIKPIFRLCNIETTVYVTKAPKQAYDLLDKLDLKGVDGIITVGGDGIYCEVMNALIVRTQKDHGVNVHDPDARIVPSTIPVGIIPAGTGDCVAQYLHGTRDVITAALHIVLGNTTPSNAVSVHQGGKLSAYAGLVLGFGLQGDMMYDCEKFRWMGQSRYNVVPITNVLNRRTFEIDVEYVDNDSGETKKISDTMYSVDTYVISKAERGDKLVPKFGDLVLSAYTTSKCNLGKHVQQLSKLQDGTAGCFDYDFVKEIRTQGYKVRFPRAAVISNNGGSDPEG